MAQANTLVYSWIGITSAEYPIRVEEHRSDLAYFVEFYDADELSSGAPISHCPVSGELLSVATLHAEVEVDSLLLGRD